MKILRPYHFLLVSENWIKFMDYGMNSFMNKSNKYQSYAKSFINIIHNIMIKLQLKNWKFMRLTIYQMFISKIFHHLKDILYFLDFFWVSFLNDVPHKSEQTILSLWVFLFPIISWSLINFFFISYFCYQS